jgi:hypothetical protein
MGYVANNRQDYDLWIALEDTQRYSFRFGCEAIPSRTILKYDE